MVGRRAELRIGVGERVGGEDSYENERKERVRKEQKRMEEWENVCRNGNAEKGVKGVVEKKNRAKGVSVGKGLKEKWRT